MAATQEQGLDKKMMPQLGWLTCLHRDTWADARTELLQVGGTAMKEALFQMESAAFVINLDHEVSIVRDVTFFVHEARVMDWRVSRFSIIAFHALLLLPFLYRNPKR